MYAGRVIANVIRGNANTAVAAAATAAADAEWWIDDDKCDSVNCTLCQG